MSKGQSQLIIKTLKEMIISLRFKIPEGDYLLCLHDGTHYAYAWPVLAFASTKKLVENGDIILFPDPEAIVGYQATYKSIDKNLDKYPWEQKIAKIFWRGSATNYIRVAFLNYTANLDFVDAGLTWYTFGNAEEDAKIAAVYKLKPRIMPADSIAYKYLFDIDGVSCSYSRMAWALYSKSVLMKHQSDKIQWYYNELQPYVHYLPINEDFSNLREQFAWAETHTEEVKEIANNAHNLARKVFNETNVRLAMARAFQQYHALIRNKAIPD